MTNDDAKIRSNSQIIVGAFAAGVAIFLAVAWFLWHRDAPRVPAESTPLLSNMAAAMLVATLPAWFIAKKAMSRLENGVPTFAVLGGALLEFPGLFGCTAYLLEGTDLAFGVALVSIFLLLALQFPTERRWERWTSGARPADRDVPDQFDLDA